MASTLFNHESNMDDAWPRRYSPRRDYLYWMMGSLFFITMLLSIALVKFGPPGLPVRALTSILLIFLTLFSAPRMAMDAIASVRVGLFVILIFALLGILANLLNDVPADVGGRQILELQVQALISLVAGACLVRACGPDAVALIWLSCIAVTSVVAMGQGLSIDVFWSLRDALQRMQPIDVSQDNLFLTLRSRAMGVSYTPVHLGIQLCLGFAAFFSWRLAASRGSAFTRFDPLVWMGFASFAFVAIVSGNRSPLLGMVVFAVAYLFLIRPTLAVLLGLTFLPLIIFLDDILDWMAATGLRAARVQDKSSEGRAALRALGFWLFVDQPYGYGLSFNASNYWSTAWDKIKDYPNAIAVRVWPTHNAYLNILNKYGILSLLMGAWAFWSLWRQKFLLLAFLPYCIHIFYHNDGPMMGDFMIFFILPAILAHQHEANFWRSHETLSVGLERC